jgi:hypothetical protein
MTSGMVAVSVNFDTNDSGAQDADNEIVLSILNMDESLGPVLGYAFVQHVGQLSADVNVTWMTDDSMEDSFGKSFRKLSAASTVATFPCEVYLNYENWRHLRAHQQHWLKLGLNAYRQYQVCHEFGHALGVEHLASREDEKCNVMTSQTYTKKCTPNHRFTSADVAAFKHQKDQGGFRRPSALIYRPSNKQVRVQQHR